MYGVSIKTVRDIRVGRTWYRATCHLDASEPPAIERLAKKLGRPKGTKDSGQRIKKISVDTTEISVYVLFKGFVYVIDWWLRGIPGHTTASPCRQALTSKSKKRCLGVSIIKD